MPDKTNTGRFREITIPGDVLDDEKLSDGAKIMYGKIARLSFKNGFCTASNYFLDGTKSGRNASRFIAELKNEGFILIENERSKFRKIRICTVSSRVYSANSVEAEYACPAVSGMVEGAHIANSGEVENILTPPNLAGSGHIANSGEVENIPTPPNLAGSEALHRQTWRGETAHIANSGGQTLEEEEVEEASSSAFPEIPETTPAAESSFSPEEIKQALLAVDQNLFLDNFYPKAAGFMAKHRLGLGYVAFIYKEVESSNYKSFKAMYYTIFFKDDKPEEYKALNKPSPPAQPPPPDEVKCPACGTVHDKNLEICPNCSLPKYSTPQNISLFRELLAFPLDRRNEYLKREKVIYSEFKWDFEKLKTMIKDLRSEFGLKAEHERPSRSYRP